MEYKTQKLFAICFENAIVGALNNAHAAEELKTQLEEAMRADLHIKMCEVKILPDNNSCKNGFA